VESSSQSTLMLMVTVGLCLFNIIVEGQYVGGFGGGVGDLYEGIPDRPYLPLWLMHKVSCCPRGLLVLILTGVPTVLTRGSSP
jgi:hypothetical protein